jgi:competence ComEA-like helix-hairpin-helix protein
MTSISLRAYNREIEDLIERGQNDEAIAHCMQILQSTPKHISTYRLLGKALLESQRFKDAVDIFQRVLSSVPDDYISHVGMSIVREKEKNLDGAIWHMERAFESQPANAAIQDELRRLYGRRDGMEPPKIRLTRGALARMYAKGHLYNQAIGELQAALAEDSKRPDLQVLLAIMYHRSGQREQAVKTCQDLMKKLPYSLEANRILADLLPEGDRKTYRQRLISLDPYYAHLEPRTPTSDRVPENAVVVERLSYQAGQPRLAGPSEPEWASTLGAAFDSPQAGALPEWATPEETATAPFQENFPPFGESEPTGLDWAKGETPAAATEDLIPDFLKEAGWEKTDRTADEIAMEEMQREQEAEEGIIPAEIPDWLREMAPEGALEQPTAEEGSTDEELLPWLEAEEPGPTDSVVSWLEETKKPASPEEIESLQAALQEASEPQELPDWVSGLETEEGAIIEEQVESTGSVEPWNVEEELPAWLQSPEREHSGVTDELPGWLRGSTEISTGFPSEPEVPVAEEAPVLEEAESLPTGYTEEITSTTEPIEAAEPALEIPDWLKGLEEEGEEEGEEEAEAVAEVPVQPEEPEPALIEGDTAPWIIPTAETEAPTAEEPAFAAALEAEPAGDETVIQAPMAAAEFDLENPDAALAWLESLAMQQGAAADQLTTRPEERPETPEWLRDTAQEALERGEVPTYEPTETVEGLAVPPAAEPEAPELAAQGEEVETFVFEELSEQQPAPVEEAAPAEEIPDWLKELEGEEPLAEALAVPEAELPEDEWKLEELAVPSETAEAAPVEEIPDWLKEPAVQEPALETTTPPSAEEAWVEPEPALAETGLEKMPDWLLESELLEEAEPAGAAEEWDLVSAEAPTQVSKQEAELEPVGLIDINNASLRQLEELPGIGFILAQAIINYREANGPFHAIEELEKVSGIGPVLVEELRNRIEVTLEEEPAAPAKLAAVPQTEDESVLMAGLDALETSNLEVATEKLGGLIHKEIFLAEIIRDLQEAIYRQPDEIGIWELLGDAYMRNQQLQEALDAYNRAEELLA